MEKTISEVMSKEHKRLELMLEDFEKLEIVDFEKSKIAFSRFKWNLDKHFFIEEKVIFHVYNKSSEEENFDIINLLKDHKDIQWLVAKMEESLRNNLKPQVLELKKLLYAHAGLEDAVFYPRLDSELEDFDKELILERTDEIIGE